MKFYNQLNRVINVNSLGVLPILFNFQQFAVKAKVLHLGQCYLKWSRSKSDRIRDKQRFSSSKATIVYENTTMIFDISYSPLNQNELSIC